MPVIFYIKMSNDQYAEQQKIEHKIDAAICTFCFSIATSVWNIKLQVDALNGLKSNDIIQTFSQFINDYSKLTVLPFYDTFFYKPDQ